MIKAGEELLRLQEENQKLGAKVYALSSQIISLEQDKIDLTNEIKGLKDGIAKAIEESYKKGLTDVWECARKIGDNSQLGLEEMGFDFSELGTYYNPSWWVVLNYDVFKVLDILKRNTGEQNEL